MTEEVLWRDRYRSLETQFESLLVLLSKKFENDHDHKEESQDIQIERILHFGRESVLVIPHETHCLDKFRFKYYDSEDQLVYDSDFQSCNTAPVDIGGSGMIRYISITYLSNSPHTTCEHKVTLTI